MSDDLDRVGQAVLETLEETDPDGDSYVGVTVAATTDGNGSVTFDYVPDSDDEAVHSLTKLDHSRDAVETAVHNQCVDLAEQVRDGGYDD